MPTTATEIALIGRSNVGKSSLINALANQRRLAFTSKTPGATRLINAFELSTQPTEGRPSSHSSAPDSKSNASHDPKHRRAGGGAKKTNASPHEDSSQSRWLIDLPGYGFSRASKAEQRRWAAMAEGYLCERNQLRGVLHLIDGRIGPTALDLRTANWLEHIGLPVSYIATKADKVRPSHRARRRSELAKGLQTERGDVLWVSAVKGSGIAELRRKVAALLNA